MQIRRAEIQDVPQLLRLLHQVLELHAQLRPDIFRSGTTKYTEDELYTMLRVDTRAIYVAAESGRILGYAFCILRSQPFSNNMVQFQSLFIDDLCVDQDARGQGVGHKLFDYLRGEAKRLQCYELTLNVWEGNDSARRFYENLGMRPKETQMELIL